MGWNTFKKHFGITHIVQIRERDLLIGSSYISALVSINMDTGMIQKEEHYRDRFLRENYPNVSAAMPSEIKALLDTEDTFAESIPVYTYEGLKILKKYCEEVGYSNVTHDGVLMYDNTFSTNIDLAVEWAKHERASRFETLRERIYDLSNRVDDAWREVHVLEKEEITFE